MSLAKDIGKSPAVYAFPGHDDQWSGSGRSLLKLDGFRRSLAESSGSLKAHGIDIYSVIAEGEETQGKLTHRLSAITAIQVH